MVWQVILRVRPIPAGQDSCLALVEGTSKVQTTTPPNSVNFKILGEQVGRLAGIGCVCGWIDVGVGVGFGRDSAPSRGDLTPRFPNPQHRRAG